MKDFDVFTPMLIDSIRINKWLYLIAKEGDEKQFGYSLKKDWQTKITIVFTDLKSRITESSRLTKARVTIYDSGTFSITENATYRNTKGVYFKKQGKNYYI